MTVLAIDPGPTESAYVWLDESAQILDTAILPAAQMEGVITERAIQTRRSGCRLVIEKVESFGMAVGASVFETVYNSGRFAALWEQHAGPAERIGRKAVKLHLCGNPRAKDSNIRARLIDLYGGTEGKAAAIGTKAHPGPLYGVKSHQWAALAVGVTALDADYWRERGRWMAGE